MAQSSEQGAQGKYEIYKIQSVQMGTLFFGLLAMSHCSITCRSLRGRRRRTKQSLNRIRKLLYQTYTLIRRAELFCLLLGLGGCFVASLLAMTRLFIKAWGKSG